MNLFFDKKLKTHFPKALFWVAFSLSVMGLINLHSATYNITTGKVSPLFISQMIWFAIGFLIAFICLLVDYRILISFAYPAYFISILLLLLVIFFGKEVAGNKNWLVIGPLTMQPSELAKLAFIIALARYLADHPASQKGYGWLQMIRPVLLLLPPLIFILLGKDIGSSLFLMATFVTLLLFSGVRKNVVLLSLLIGMTGSVGAYKKMSDHQRGRIEAFVHPDEDPRGRGYHLLQSKIAVGSGKFFGKGYLKGMHNKLLYLPEKHTDFIFPVLSEEWGFLGSLVVLGLYLAILIMGVQLASKAKERFGIFVSLGVTALFFWQIVINLGGVLGLLPLTGVTLPLLSYGGSSLVMVMVGMSLLMNISMRRFMF